MLQMNSKNKFFHQNNYNKLYGLLIIFLWLLLSYLVLFVTRIDPNQEMAQKIFYFHVPSAWIAGVSYLVVMISGVNYLRTKNNYWDYVSYSSAEIGTIFCALVLITGPIWATPIWGTSWSWEPRLTTVLIMFLIYLGYFSVRNFGKSLTMIKSICATIGILAFLNVPIIYFSVKLWAEEVQLHPQPEMLEQPTDIYYTFIFSLIVFFMIYLYLLNYRIHILKIKSKFENILENN
tara:strand:+ start:1532 stop:2233 length:702 start_codon:yes stop_codon:yes gene_type:complete